MHYGQKFDSAHLLYADSLLGSMGLGGEPGPQMSAGVGPALWKVSAALRDVQAHQRSSLASTEVRVGRLQQSGEEELRRIKEAKRRFHACDEEWAVALRRAHSVKREKESKVAGADRDCAPPTDAML